MAYFVNKVVICGAFAEPDKHYQLLSGGRSQLLPVRRPSMRLSASARDIKGGIVGIVGREATLFEDMDSFSDKNDFVNQLRDHLKAWRPCGLAPVAIGDPQF